MHRLIPVSKSLLLLLTLFLAACNNQDTTTATSSNGKTATVLVGLRQSLVGVLSGDPADLAAVASITLTVSARDMSTLTVALPLNGDTIAIDVPAGINRVFSAVARDASNVVTHTGSTTLADLIAGSRVRLNLTLDPVGPDTTAPTVTGTSPADGVVDVAISSAISVTFSEAMDPATIDTSTFTVSGATGTVSYSGTTAMFTPDVLANGTAYTVTVSTGVTDTAGNGLAADYVFSFTTVAAGSPPSFSGLTLAVPSSSTTVDVAWEPATDDVSASAQIVYDISVATTSGAPFNADYTTAAGATDYTITGLTEGTDYYIVVRARDEAGNRDANVVEAHVKPPIAGPDPFNVPPLLYDLQGTPKGGVAGGVTFYYYDFSCGDFTLDFGDGISDFQSCPADGGPVYIDHVYATPGTYTVTLDVADFLSPFTTQMILTTEVVGATGDLTPPTVTSISPVNGEKAVDPGTVVTVEFSEAMDPVTINTSTITVTGPSGSIVGTVDYTGTTATFTPTTTLDNAAIYTVNISTGVKDVAGNAMAASTGSVFTTIAAQRMQLVSLASDGTLGNGYSGGRGWMSVNGRYVVFESTATNLVAVDTNGFNDIFVHDLQTGATTRVSVASDTTQSNEDSADPRITADGRYVVFHSAASNLVAGDTNGTNYDVFVHDRNTGTTTRQGLADGNVEIMFGAFSEDISDDGRYVLFSAPTSAADVVRHLYLHDSVSGTTTQIDVADDGSNPTGQSENFVNWGAVSLSSSGRYTAFYSVNEYLVANDTNSARDVFVRDRLGGGSTTRVSVASDSTEANGNSYSIDMTPDARYVVFDSTADNLVPNDTNTTADVFVRDRTLGTIERVSVASDGSEKIPPYSNYNDPGYPSISDDGRYVVFASDISNLVPNDTNGMRDIFVHDRTTGQTVRVNVADGGAQANFASDAPVISGDGSVISFLSCASNLVVNDTNGQCDVFIVPRP